MRPDGELAPVLQSFFADRLAQQLGASAHTISSYRDTLRLLLEFAQRELRKEPAHMCFAELDAPFIVRFLEHLEKGRGNSARTRNTRLAAIHSLYRFAALKVPSQSATIQRVLSIPHKRFDKREVDYLVRAEVDALVAAPDLTRVSGRRDKALLMVAVETGLRVSELTSAQVVDLVLGRTTHLRCRGKGRKDRATPLSRETASVLRQWLRERAPLPSSAPLFPNAAGGALTRDGVAYLLRKHHQAASQSCPSLKTKRLTPHVLRHTAAMRLLEGGVDRAVIALWLGHESVETTQVYFHADMRLKEKALAGSDKLDGKFKRYRPTDKLLAFLTGL